MSPQTRNILSIVVIVLVVLIIGGMTWFFLSRSHPVATVTNSASSTNPFSGATSAQNIADTGAPATKYPDHGKYYDIDLQYPSSTPLVGTASAQADAAAVQALKDFTTTTAAGFKSDGNFDTLTPQDISMQGLDQGRKYALSDTYQYYSSPVTISYLFDISSDTLGAHPNSYYKSFTFDAKTGQQLALSDLFVSGSNYLSVLSSLSQADLKTQLGSNGDSDMISQGTAASNDNFQSFALDGSNLVIFFDPYAVASYAQGPQTVKIPLSQLSSVLKAAYK